MKVLRRLLPIVVVLSAIAAGGWWLYQTRFAPTAGAASASDGFTQVVAVQRGDLSASLSVVGELYAVQQGDLYFDRLAGTTPLLTLSVEAGHVVQEGQEMATIDPSPYQQALDQAKSDLQEAEEVLADLQTPASDLDVAQADLAAAQAELKLEQAKQDLQDLQSPDTSKLQTALKTAQDDLALARVQQTLTEYDSLVKSERDLLYAVDWHERRINELQALVSQGQARPDQAEELAEEQKALAETRSELARLQSQRQLALQVASAEVAAATAAVAEAGDALAEAQAGVDELDLAKAELAVSEAEVALAQALQKRADLDEGVDPVKLAAAQASLDKKRLAVAGAEADLQAATMRAPFAGTILATAVEPGNLLNKNRRILTIANLDELRVRAAVDETTIRQIEAGQAAVITFDAFPGQQFRGQVLAVPLQGTLQGDVMVYQVPVSLQGAEELPLLVGMTANVAIQVGQVEDALLVPAMALQNVGGFYQVLLSAGSDPQAEPQAVPVEVGLSDGLYTEIVRGLNEGDQVLVQMQATDAGQFGFDAMRMMGGGGAFRPR
ncbi:MAG: efflux RND transporter periplasmic adaptor subunit [Chloroflexi bacterium]|nr:efflux RND transporter periplasmic adaptor subunit [Chloroflexota bacterium]